MKDRSRSETRRALYRALLCVLAFGIPRGEASAVTFGAPQNVSKSRARVDTLAAVAVDANNKVHIAWNGFFAKAGAPDGVASDIYYTTNAPGAFGAPVRIRVPAGWYSRDATIAVDPAGHAHIVFRRSVNQASVLSDDDLYYVTNANGDFKHPVRLIDGGFGADSPVEVSAPHDPLVHCDRLGRVHVTCLAFSIGGLSDAVVYLTNRSGGWTKPAPAVRGDFVTHHSSALDRNGYLHIAFPKNDKSGRERIYYAHNRSGKFSPPVAASASQHEHPMQFQLAIDGRAKAHLVYRAPFVMPGTPDLFYVDNTTGSFKSWRSLCPGNTYYIPQIAVDSGNVVHIAYKAFPVYGGALHYGNNAGGTFKFSAYGGLTAWWYVGSRYFVLGKSGAFHFAVYDFVDSAAGSDAEIFYLSGSAAK